MRYKDMLKYITKQGWTLVHKETGDRVVQDELVKSFRDESYIITGGNPPHHSGSTGKVHVTPVADTGAWNRELYPQVFELEWRQGS
tara:strand:+ start:1030 stop:1287 length:258 start_codon:yes stop_codon:yes gene_type:complete